MATDHHSTAPRERGAGCTCSSSAPFLSNMVMPNIGAIIAWGLITALFIEIGWTPRTRRSPDDWGLDGGIVGPMINYLLPILIAYTGGKLVYDIRGGVVGGSRHRRHHGLQSPVFAGDREVADVPRRHDHGPARRLVDEEARRALGRQDQARLRDAGQQLLRRHPGRRSWPSSASSGSRPVARWVTERARRRRSTPWSTTTCSRWPRSSSSRPRCCSSTTPSTTAC